MTSFILPQYLGVVHWCAIGSRPMDDGQRPGRRHTGRTVVDLISSMLKSAVTL
jgi:hypothetical protein